MSILIHFVLTFESFRKCFFSSNIFYSSSKETLSTDSHIWHAYTTQIQKCLTSGEYASFLWWVYNDISSTLIGTRQHQGSLSAGLLYRFRQMYTGRYPSLLVSPSTTPLWSVFVSLCTGILGNQGPSFVISILYLFQDKQNHTIHSFTDWLLLLRRAYLRAPLFYLWLSFWFLSIFKTLDNIPFSGFDWGLFVCSRSEGQVWQLYTKLLSLSVYKF